MFGASIILGTLSGVIASAAPLYAGDGPMLKALLEGTANLALWPVIGAAVAFGYVWMVVSWLVDLHRIELGGGVEKVWRVLSARWLGRHASSSPTDLLQLAMSTSRGGLVAVSTTLAASVVLALAAS